MTELRNLVTRHADIIAHYYAEYIAGYDAILLAELVQQFGSAELSEYETLLVKSCVQAMQNIKSMLNFQF